MLVLGRKPEERILIGDDIVITLLEVKGDQVQIGIEAPSDVRILRHELYESVKEENLRAAETQSADTLSSLGRLFQDELVRNG